MVQMNLAKGLDRSYEDKSLPEIFAAPPSALAGLTREHDAVLRESFGIDTVGDLGSNKYFALAGVLGGWPTRRADQPHTAGKRAAPDGERPSCCVRLYAGVRPAGGWPTRRTRG